MIGLTSVGGLNADGIEGETRQILQNLSAALSEISLSLHDMVAASIFTTRFDQFPMINKVWEEFFTLDIPPPARTSIGVAALPLGALVEMSFRFYRE